VVFIQLASEKAIGEERGFRPRHNTESPSYASSMRLAELTFSLILAWSGPGPLPPPVFLGKDVTANLKTEGPSSLVGILGFLLLVFLAVVIAYSYFVGPFWYAIVAAILFILTVGLVYWRST